MHNWVTNNFSEVHRSYTRRISLIAVPLMLAQAALGLQTVISLPGILPALQLGLIAFVWGVTAFISVPLHRRLSAGDDGQVIDRLINTNWLRTIGWSLVSLLDWTK